MALENILRRLEYMAQTGQKPYAATFLLPLMKKVKYDPRSAPTLLEDQVIKVMIGIHVQSISNFELTTMVRLSFSQFLKLTSIIRTTIWICGSEWLGEILDWLTDWTPLY